MNDEPIIIDTPDGIAFFRLLSMRGRLRLETKGITFRGPSVLKQLQREGITKARTKVQALADLEAYIEAIKEGMHND